MIEHKKRIVELEKESSDGKNLIFSFRQYN
ncbi:hypothetical protein METP3_02647 [Methanosarcinales archaeon]|nr:hypothetical protein METP3_02647 [Methanosarcinales archaeon]